MIDRPIEDTGVRNIERRHLKLFKHNFCHSFTVFGRIPSRLSHEDGVFFGVDMHGVFKSMSDKRRNGSKVLYYEELRCFVDILSVGITH